MCQKGFKAITGLSKSAFTRAMRRINVDKKQHYADRVDYGVDHGGSTHNNAKDKSMAMAWLRGMADRLGQYLPNAKETRLPFSTKQIVHDYYVAEMNLRGVTPLKYGTFLLQWSKHPEMSTIKLSKKKGSFAQCDMCAGFATETTKAIDNRAAEEIKARWNIHIEHVTRCP